MNNAEVFVYPEEHALHLNDTTHEDSSPFDYDIPYSEILSL